VLLLVSLAYVWINSPDRCWKTSISAYYHTPAQAIFIGSLCAVGTCLIVYRGRNDLENTLLDYTGFMAFIVAFVPITPDGICGGSTVPVEWSYVQNSTMALFAVGSLGAFAAMRFKFLRANRDSLSKHARWALGIAIVALVAGIIWIVQEPESFNSIGHYVAAGALFLGVFSVVALHAVGFARRPEGAGRLTRNWYLIVATAMVLSVMVFVVAKEIGYVHWLLALEAALILAFAWFWFIQTHDHRGTVPPPPAPEPDPLVGIEGDHPAEPALDGGREPEAGSAPTAEDEPAQTLPAEQQQ